jgi:coatomer subunit beta
MKKQTEVAAKSSLSLSSTKPVVLADGTYSTQTSATEMIHLKPMVLPGSLSTTLHLKGHLFCQAIFLWLQCWQIL